MECADPHATNIVRQQCLKTLTHLCCSLVSKRNSKNLPRTNAFIGNHMRNSKRQNTSLTRTSSCKNQQRSLSCHNCLVLGRIQTFKINLHYAILVLIVLRLKVYPDNQTLIVQVFISSIIRKRGEKLTARKCIGSNACKSKLLNKQEVCDNSNT